MVWKVRADCTYTSTSNKTARQNAVEALLPQHPAGFDSSITIGRFPGGVTSQSSTRFTVAVDFDDADGDAAKAFVDALRPLITASTRSTTYFSIHLAKGF